VCFNAGTGGSYCVPAANAQRKPPASGGETAGSTCVGDGDCRSGLCANNRCLDTCCVQSDCAAGSTCAVASVAKHDVWVCVETVVGARNLGTTCAAQTECKNDNCVQSAGSANPAVCTPSCCSSASCDAQGFTGYHCAYGTSGTDQLKWCVKTASGGGLFPLGTSCQQSLECQSTYCDPELKKCLSPCCKDSDCAASEACRPSALSTPFLRCVPKAR
jgi:hypothetical protein